MKEHVIAMSTTSTTIADQIEQQIMGWPGVESRPHRFGGVEFVVRGHEIGHLHGSHQADLPFSTRTREELVAAGRASLHHILPETGWVTYYIRGTESVSAVVDLFRLNYDRYYRAATTPVSAQVE